MFCAVLDFKTNCMEYASAGAMPQLYRPSAEEPFELITEPGVPLGLMRDIEYDCHTVPFRPGGALLLYTDALIETPRPPKSIFTAQSLKAYLNEATGTQDALQICRTVIHKVCSNSSVKLDDDLTLIVARHIGDPVTSTTH
jgi:sigma-B regulation protein RsbU (phosphoserine phosphatase)